MRTNKASLFKYFPMKYKEQFLREGSIIFRSLSYFTEIDQTCSVRKDENEGNYYFSGKPEENYKLFIDGQELPGSVANLRIGYSFVFLKNYVINFGKISLQAINLDLKSIAALKSKISRFF